MSTPTIRRIKERGGGGGAKITAPPSKTLTSPSTGKENPLRPVSRSRASVAVAPIPKPAVQQIPRFTRSNSAAPKGRSSSPFEFRRALSDIRKNQGLSSKVSEIVKPERSVSSGRRSVSGRGFDRCQPNIGSLDVNSGERLDKIDLDVRDKNGDVRNSNVKSGKRVSLGRIEVGSEKSREICKKNESFLRNSSVKSGERVNVEKIEVGLDKSGEFCKENEPGLKGSGDLASRVLGRSQQKNGSLKDSNVKLGESVEKLNGDIERVEIDIEKSGEICKKNYLGFRGNSDLPVRGFKERKSIVSDEGLRDLGAKNTNAVRGSERLKQKAIVEENVSGRSVNKYPSKLHEKLAFLEGKVKRIASDIKKTKEMLDMNNPDSSKVILSDIQEKISGIEKAMGNVAGTDKQIHVLESGETKEKILGNEKVMGSVFDGDEHNNPLEIVERKEMGNMNSSVNGLNSEELEARLFPHHKLLRDRTSVKLSSESSEKLDLKMKVEELLSSHVNDNPVEVEFLSSLGNDQNKVTVRGENVGAKVCGVQETDETIVSKSQDNLVVVGKDASDIILTTDETLDDFDEQQIKSKMIIDEEIEDTSTYQFNEIGYKTSTGGWFVADGEAALLAHDDGSCSYYDIANSEVKSEYKPPTGISPNMWRDCWIVRAPGADGSSGRYIVAASAGNTSESGFCSWDFYVKNVRAFHIEDGTTNSTRTALAPLPNYPSYRRNSFSSIIASENRQWWYRPSGPLISSTATNQKAVAIYDIRDGEQIMKWELQKPVLSMEHSSPLQWRNRGKVVIAEAESISLWDVNSLTPQALQSISTTGRRVYALHVNNTDAELGGGVRQRVTSSEAEGNDGVFCTADSINVLDFRNPSGIGLKISKTGINPQSVFSRGDSVFLGGTSTRSTGKNQPCPQIQHFSLRKQRLFNTYAFPDSNAHPHYTAITQVWGNSNFVMGVCGLGLFVFDALNDDGVSLSTEYCGMQKVKETVGPDDLYSPSFDYLSSRVLLISRDRPALWRYLS